MFFIIDVVLIEYYFALHLIAAIFMYIQSSTAKCDLVSAEYTLFAHTNSQF